MTWELALKVIIAAALLVFAPQILKWLRKIGYRDWRDRK